MVGGDQKLPRIIFMYKKMFFLYYVLHKLEKKGLKTNNLVFDHFFFNHSP